jgi:predicted permease
MALFSIVFFKIISILLSVIVGYVAGRMEKVERESIASLLFYFIAPIVFFSVPASANLSISDIGVAFLTFTIATILSLAAYKMYSGHWDEESRNLLATSAGSGNTGYFMLPIATALFDDYTLSIYMMAVVGVNIYESSVGYYICARSISSTQESIKQILRLPMLHAFGIGCICSLLGLTLPDFLDDFLFNMRGTYSILGMMMIGLGLSKLKNFVVDIKFTLACFFSKFVMYPVAVNIFIALDKLILKWYDTPEHHALLLLSTAPMAANTIVISSIMKLQPERVATSVLLSCIFSLIFIPLIATLSIGETW